MRIYLASRVALDARMLNSRVAESLRRCGFTVYVPHEEKPNNPTDGRFDKDEIWRHDFAAMNSADLCVVVGRFGKDVSAEVGWFYARGVPTFFVPGGDTTFDDSPMLRPALNRYPHILNPEKTGEEILAHYRRFIKQALVGAWE